MTIEKLSEFAEFDQSFAKQIIFDIKIRKCAWNTENLM